MVADFVFLMLVSVWMDEKNVIRNIKHLGRNGLIILFFITEVDIIIHLVDTECGLSLCGTLLNGNKSVVLSGGIMEILNSYIAEREGNDCLITEGIMLVRITNRAYVVTYTRDVLGGWTGNPIEANSRSFHSYDEAKICYNKLYEQIK